METYSSKKKNLATLNNRALLNNRAVYIALEPMKLVQRWNKVERKYMKVPQPKQLHCCNQNMDFVNYRIGTQMKNDDGGLRLLGGDVVPQNV